MIMLPARLGIPYEAPAVYEYERLGIRFCVFNEVIRLGDESLLSVILIGWFDSPRLPT